MSEDYKILQYGVRMHDVLQLFYSTIYFVLLSITTVPTVLLRQC